MFKPDPTTRIRRGKEVEIPEEWQGKVTRSQTIHKRRSKLSKAARHATPKDWQRGNPRERTEARAPRVDEF